MCVVGQQAECSFDGETLELDCQGNGGSDMTTVKEAIKTYNQAITISLANFIEPELPEDLFQDAIGVNTL